MIRFIVSLTIFINFAITSIAQTAPDFTFTDINGTVHNLQHALDQNYIVVVEFFFADCGPCITAATELQDIHEDYADKNVLVWAISDIDDNDRILQFHEEMELDFISGGVEGGGVDVINLLCETNDFIAYPTVSFICPDGELTWDIYPYSLGAPEWRMAIEKCGIEDVELYQPFGNIATDVSRFSAQKTDIQISPNPASDFINIELEEDNTATTEITIHNATGQFVKKIIQNPLKSSRPELTIPTGNMANGIYHIQVKIDNQIIGTSRFIINK